MFICEEASMVHENPFKWKHFSREIIVLCVRWYLRYALSYRDLEEMMLERGVKVSHTTIYRWVIQYGPEVDRRVRSQLKSTNDSYRVDETYIKVKGERKYLYRAVDSTGDTIDFLPQQQRDMVSAKRFFVKALGSPHTRQPRVINVDKNRAYPIAIRALKKEGALSESCQIRITKYLNNIVEQDRRFIKRLVRPGHDFSSFPTASATLVGYEAMNMIRKGQVHGVPKGAILAQVKCVKNLFGIAA